MITFLARRPWLISVLAIICLVVLDLISTMFWNTASVWINYALYWLILTGLFFFLSEYSWRQYAIDELKLFTRLFAVGFILGLSIAIYRGLYVMELWTLFNLLAEPLRAGLYAILIGWVVANIQREKIN